MRRATIKARSSLASLQHMFGTDYDETRTPLLIQSGMECLGINVADYVGVNMSPDDVEMAAIEAHDNFLSVSDSIGVALVSIAVIAAKVDMPAHSRAAIESIIQLNLAKLEEKFC